MARWAILLTLAMLVGCGGNPQPAPGPPGPVKAEPKELPLTEEDRQMMAAPLVPVRFKHFAQELVIDAPQDAKVEEGLITRIRRGSYLVQISTERDLAQIKKNAKASSLHPFLGEAVDEEHLYAFKQKDYDGSVQYVFECNVKVGDRVFGVHNENISPTPKTKEQLDWVLTSVKTLRAP